MTESTLDRTAIEDLRRQFQAKLAVAGTPQQLAALKDEFLGRKAGLVTTLLKNLGSLPADAHQRMDAPDREPAARQRDVNGADRRARRVERRALFVEGGLDEPLQGVESLSGGAALLWRQRRELFHSFG